MCARTARPLSWPLALLLATVCCTVSAVDKEQAVVVDVPPTTAGPPSDDAVLATLEHVAKDVPHVLDDVNKNLPVALEKTGALSEAVPKVIDQVGKSLPHILDKSHEVAMKDVKDEKDEKEAEALPEDDGLAEAIRVALPSALPLDQESGESPTEALHKARLSLQRTLDQVLQEAEEWAQHSKDDATGQYEDYEDLSGDDAIAAEEALHNTRAELQKRLDDMLTEVEKQALEHAMAEEGSGDAADDNALPELPVSTTTSPAKEAVPDEPGEGDDNQVQGKLLTFADVPDLVPTSTQPPSTTTQPTTTLQPSSTGEPSTTSRPSSTSRPSTTTDSPATSSSTEPPTPAPPTTESPWRHLVVPLNQAESEGSAAIPAAVHGDRDAGTREVALNDDVVEAAVAAAATLDADRTMATTNALSGSACPAKQPEPLRLPALPNGAPESFNPQCAAESRLLDLNLRNHTLWAVQMQDAGSSGISGLLEGNVYHLGNFDECMEVLGPVSAQYCVVDVHVHTPARTPDYRHHPDTAADPMQSVWNHIRHEGEAWRLPLDTLHVAICAPASCSPRDLQDSVQRALDSHAGGLTSRLPVAYTVTVSEALCTSAAKQRPPLSKGEAVYIALVTLLVLAVIAGTLIDVYATKKKGMVRKPLLLFSLKSNWRLLTKTDPKPMGLNLDALSGARTINMLVLVVAHRGFNLLRGPVHNYNHFEKMPRALLQTGATHAQLFVDTCFVMSGLLVSLLELTRAHAHGKDSDSRVTLMAAFVHRYVRLTPSYALVVFFYATIFWRLGSGPLWDQVIGHESQACSKYWWTNLFYVNNYVSSEKLCMFQSWYLPCDLHLFFIGTILTLLLSRHRRTGLAFIVVFLAVSMIIPFFVTLLGSKPALLEMLPSLFRAPDQSENFRTMYAPTHIRAAPYMVGLLAGYLFQRLALKYKDRFTAPVTWLLCAGGVALGTAALLSSVAFYDPDTNYSGVVAGLYAALCPVVWSVGVCLFFASIVLGSKTLVSTILSWKPLVVLSRLTYNVYLTHWAFQMVSVAKARAPFHLDVYNLFFLSFGDMVFSFMAALVLFLLVEAPFRTLARGITAPAPESKVHLEAAREGRATALEEAFKVAMSRSKENP
ncbi:nose resistant to fluoxetine protein 6-like [Thrips palmi]|uniref:Nose resistant to fluoxetine protein 6-like n=1 Tax=Thrips palmi TaxID=161013 RepID=A0A6P8YVB7_THRPL|nr:nose resistant to fluoxetine protein 6-like [Thrips palmi]